MSAAPRPHLSLHPGLEGSLLGSPNRGPSSIPGQSPGWEEKQEPRTAVFLLKARHKNLCCENLSWSPRKCFHVSATYLKKKFFFSFLRFFFY